MYFEFEGHNTECSECKINKKIGKVLYRLLCINNFYEAMDYMLIELIESFRIEQIFTLEISDKSDIYIYKKYDKIKGNANKNVLIPKDKLASLARNNIIITVGSSNCKKIWICIKPFKNKKNEKTFYLYKNFIENILNALYKRKIREDYLTKKSYFDELTGCYNRNFFETRLKEYSNCLGVGIIVCDLDGLKQINDALGHSFGDQIIQSVAKSIRKIISREDLFFRIGGDEFVIITENRSLIDISIIVALIKNKFKISNGKNDNFPISVSVGYSLKEDKSESIKEVLKTADYFMYQHKLRHKERSKKIISEYIEKYMTTTGD